MIEITVGCDQRHRRGLSAPRECSRPSEERKFQEGDGGMQNFRKLKTQQRKWRRMIRELRSSTTSHDRWGHQKLCVVEARRPKVDLARKVGSHE